MTGERPTAQDSDGGDPPEGQPPQSQRKARTLSPRSRGLLAALLAAEAISASTLIGFGLWWVLGASADLERFLTPPSSERMIVALDASGLIAYLVPLAILAIALAYGASSTWRTRRDSEAGRGRGTVLAQSLLIGQPLLLALVPTAVIFGVNVGRTASEFGFTGWRYPPLVIAISVALGLAVAIWSLWGVHHAALRLLAIPLIVAVGLLATSVTSAWSSLARGPGFSAATFVETDVVQWASVSCPAPLRCVAFGASFIFQPPKEFATVALTTDGGQRWHDVGFPVAQLFKATHLPNAGGYIVVANVSCPTLQRCLVARADDAFPLQATELPIARSSDGGKSWHILPAPLGPSGNNLGAGVGQLACMTSSRCVLADGRAALLTGNAGTSWQLLTLIRPPPTADKVFSGANCSDALHCAAYYSWESSAQIGSSLSFRNTYKTVLLTTANGGRTWRRGPVPSGFGWVNALWCGTSGHCALSAATDPTGPGHPGANKLATSPDYGRHWAESLQTNTFSLRDITCLSAFECRALGSVANRSGLLVSRDGGMSWLVSLPGHFLTFSCAGLRFCAISGIGGDSAETQRAFLETTTNGGASWHRSSFPISPVSAHQRPYPFG